MEEQILELYDSGMSVPRISACLGISFGPIYSRLSKHGRKFQRKSRKVFVTDEQRKQILACHAEGMSNPEIAAEIGLPYSAVRSFAKKHGLKSNKWTKAAPIMRDGLMYCETCTQWKPIDDFRHYTNRHGRVRFFKARRCNACRLAEETRRVNSDPALFFRRLATGLQRRSHVHSLPFDLDADYLAELYTLQGGKCFYTDTPIACQTQLFKNKHHSLSVDRVVPERGYTKGNIVLTTARINSVKSNLSLAEIESWMPGWHARLTRCPWLVLPPPAASALAGTKQDAGDSALP
jgi:transposase